MTYKPVASVDLDILNASILIVDDDKPDVYLLTKMLTEAGYTAVSSTLNPLEVCALHRKNRYDLILLDLQMPGMDGFEVLAALKEIEPQSYLSVLVVAGETPASCAKPCVSPSTLQVTRPS